MTDLFLFPGIHGMCIFCMLGWVKNVIKHVLLDISCSCHQNSNLDGSDGMIET